MLYLDWLCSALLYIRNSAMRVVPQPVTAALPCGWHSLLLVSCYGSSHNKVDNSAVIEAVQKVH